MITLFHRFPDSFKLTVISKPDKRSHGLVLKYITQGNPPNMYPL